MQMRSVLRTRSIQTTSSAAGAARRRSTSSRAVLSRGALRTFVVGARDLGARGGEPFSGRVQRAGELLVAAHVDAPGAVGDELAERGRRVGQCGDGRRVGIGLPEHAGEPGEDLGREIGSEGVRRVLGERVGLVDDHQIVVGKHVAAGGEVHAVERVVDDEDRDLLRPARAPARRSTRRRRHSSFAPGTPGSSS